jgi:hypothetical protein
MGQLKQVAMGPWDNGKNKNKQKSLRELKETNK